MIVEILIIWNSSLIALPGFGCHPFESWKHRTSGYMWLRDGLPRDIPQARILTYGYDMKLAQTEDHSPLNSITLRFCDLLRNMLISSAQTPRRPLLFVAHSLGGVVLKCAFSIMAHDHPEDLLNIKTTFAILFFGVPSQNIESASLQTMTHGLLDRIQIDLQLFVLGDMREEAQETSIIESLEEHFLENIFPYKDSHVISFYETVASSTARWDPESGLIAMSGESVVLVDKIAAYHGRSGENDHIHWRPIYRSHSDMIRFSEWDDEYDVVSGILKTFAIDAPSVINKRMGYKLPELDGLIPPPLPPRLPWNNEPSLSTSSSIRSPETSVLGTKIASRRNSVNISDSPKPTVCRKVSFTSASALLKKPPSIERPKIDTRQEREEALLWAVQHSDEAFALDLLNRGTSVQVRDLEQNSTLHLAAANRDDSMFRLLLERGANAKATSHEKTTVLMAAVKSGLELAVKLLLEQGLDANLTDCTFRTALQIAAMQGDRDTAQCLLVHGADIHAAKATASSADGKTPLHLACEHGHKALVQLFLSRGADPNVVDHAGLTSLHHAAIKGHIYIIELLCESKAILEAKSLHKVTSLHLAVLEGKTEAAKVLLNAGAEIEASDEDNRKPLHKAALTGNEQTVALLLDNGACMDVIDKAGLTSLMVATSHGHDNVVRLLLQRGARIHADLCHDNGYLPFAHSENFEPMLAVERGHSRVLQTLLDNRPSIANVRSFLGRTLFHYIQRVEARDKEWNVSNHKAIIQLLFDQALDINVRDDLGMTPLLQAISRKVEPAVVRFLIHRGADIHAKDPFGDTTLTCAMKHGKQEATALLLIAEGVDLFATSDSGNVAAQSASKYKMHNLKNVILSKTVAGCDQRGNTSLHAMAMQGDFEGVKLLLEQGADVNATNNQHFTPLHYAVCHYYDECCRILLQRGANPLAVDRRGHSPLWYAERFTSQDIKRAIRARVKWKDVIATKIGLR